LAYWSIGLAHAQALPNINSLSVRYNSMKTAAKATGELKAQLDEVDNTEMLTVWFPVLDATIENGCLAIVPESHKRGLLLHCPSKPGQTWDLRIPQQIRGQNTLPVPMKRGSVIFLHRLTMHSSLRNLSNGVRWSFDLRYQPVGQPTGRGSCWLTSSSNIEPITFPPA
jgi:ectoine hydroxylase-related dioxygenase (phytanoyl-CoA dioxygenase family)